MSENAMLEAHMVCKEFPAGGATLRVLDGVSLSICEGEFVSIVGASGAGKTTLLQILGAIDTPTSGSVFYRGDNLVLFPPRRKDAVRSRDFGFVFQFYHLIPELNALENVILPALISNNPVSWGASRKEIRNRARALIEKLGLGGRLYHRPSQLSGGERQRIAIARALMNDPKILFCDEPTGNLDSARSREIMDLLKHLNEDLGKTVVVVTHNEEIAAAATRRFRIADGKLVD